MGNTLVKSTDKTDSNYGVLKDGSFYQNLSSILEDTAQTHIKVERNDSSGNTVDCIIGYEPANYKACRLGRVMAGRNIYLKRKTEIDNKLDFMKIGYICKNNGYNWNPNDSTNTTAYDLCKIDALSNYIKNCNINSISKTDKCTSEKINEVTLLNLTQELITNMQDLNTGLDNSRKRNDYGMCKGYENLGVNIPGCNDIIRGYDTQLNTFSSVSNDICDFTQPETTTSAPTVDSTTTSAPTVDSTTTSAPTVDSTTTTNEPNEPKDNTTLYIGIGVGVLVLVIILVLMSGGKSNRIQYPLQYPLQYRGY